MTTPTLNPLSNEWFLTGEWQEEVESITAKKDARLSLLYSARDVYLVLSGEGTIKVLVDGKTVDVLEISGKDSIAGSVQVTKDSLYHLVHEKSFQKNRLLELEFSPGVRAFAFTF